MCIFLYDFINIKKIMKQYNHITCTDCLGRKGNLTDWGFKGRV